MKTIAEKLNSLPGVGPSIAHDLEELGIKETRDLVGKNPEDLYKRLCDLKGMRIDPCVLYTFRCAVYAASTKNPDPKLLLWWNWKDHRLDI